MRRSPMVNDNTLLSVIHLCKWFELKKGIFGKVGYVKAVDDVSFDLDRGEAVSLVGESGSGKTTLGKTILRLYNPTRGKIVFEGKDISTPRVKTLMWYRKETGLVQQDPFGALPPFMNIKRILEEPLIIHKVKKSERFERIKKGLEEVRLIPIKDFINKYPHMLSGGQQQRLVIARAIILNPKLIIADEPVSMLDASVRVEILNLLRELQEKFDLTVIYITHDLSTTSYFSEWVYIMYAGNIVERAKTKELLKNPLHPYTKALLNSIPDPDPKNRFKFKNVPPGEPPNLISPPKGCRFHPRCSYFIKEKCDEKNPKEIEAKKDHFVRCWLYDQTK
jgi:peptide/nickel transport system ATP-binding protein